MIKKLFTFLLCMLFSFSLIYSQATVGISTYGVSGRDVEEDSTDIFDIAYNGLQNVGIGTQIYIKGFVIGGTLSSPAWTINQKPAGSNAAFGVSMDIDSATEVIIFKPDSVGKYVLQFADAGDFIDITINAGLYLGYDQGSPSCVDCHNNAAYNFVADKWKETGHASMLQRGLDGTLSNHYGSGCIKCHTTGYDPNADNNGFDDWGFIFPDSLFVGVYDSLKTVYPEAMKLANIQCESCHGPGSQHFGNTGNQEIAVTLSADNCAWCHDEGTHHVYPAQWDVSLHANLDHPYTRSSCAPCHNGAGFVEFVKGGKVGLSEDLPQNVNITCATCHDPHDVTNEHQLRTVQSTLENGVEVTEGGLGTLCMNCHKSRRDAKDYTDNYLDHISSHYGPHHGPQADMLMATNVPTFGKTLPTSGHLKATENACVDCHMYPGHTDSEGNVVLSGSHSFRMSTPDGVDNIAACSSCHPDFNTTFDAVSFSVNGTKDLDGDGVENGLQVEVQGLMDSIAVLLQPYGSTDINTIDSTWTLIEAQAYYDHEFVKEDGSLGIHNPAFAVSLLNASINALKGSTVTPPENFYLGNNDTQCSDCHGNMSGPGIGGNQVNEWLQTKHAIAQDSISFLQFDCLKCHNTGWDPLVDNYGADEYVTEDTTATFGWTITDPSNWDRVNNIQCEACHGALGQSDTTRVGGHSSIAKVDLSADLCGNCHTDDHHPTFDNWQESKHAVSKFTSIPGDGFKFIASNPNCSACHTAEGFLQFVKSDDIEPNVVAPGPDGHSITCATCHDPHGGPNEGQLRLPPEELCQKCHNPEYNPDEVGEPNGSAIHHSTAYMLEGKGGYEYEGFTYENSIHTIAVTKKCVACHVFMTPFQDPIPANTGHTFEPRSEACVTCHSDFNQGMGDFDYRGTQTEIDSLLTVLGDKLAAASASDSTSNNFFRAKFNYDFVNADGSHGIHNTKYARGLLTSAIANFTPTGIENEGTIPETYSLSQNYPNPFNPSTTIKFAIPENSNVKLEIYDLIGRKVTTLINSELNPGTYSVQWEASNYTSGIYFYRIETNNFTTVKKMLLLK